MFIETNKNKFINLNDVRVMAKVIAVQRRSSSSADACITSQLRQPIGSQNPAPRAASVTVYGSIFDLLPN